MKNTINTMKKLLFTFSLLIFSVVCAVAAYVPAQGDMNPFAYDLSASLNQIVDSQLQIECSCFVGNSAYF